MDSWFCAEESVLVLWPVDPSMQGGQRHADNATQAPSEELYKYSENPNMRVTMRDGWRHTGAIRGTLQVLWESKHACHW